jgi:tyrosine-protein phosphatase YwqE
MKPTTLTNNDARKFPFVEYHYQASNLENVTSRCMKMSKSFRDVSRDYFATEENYDFLSNAAIFVALIASALVPIVQLCRELPLF